MIRGSAVPTTVWSSAARKTPIITAPRTRIRTGWGSATGGRSGTANVGWVDALAIASPSLRLRPDYRPIRPVTFLITRYLGCDRDNVRTAPSPALAAPDAARLDGLGAG